jgi:predicted nucleotidyltransferase
LDGERKRNGKRFTKFYALAKRYELLKREYPQYLVTDPVFNTRLCEVPTQDIKTHYQPTKGMQKLRKKNNLDEAEQAALEFMKILQKESGVNWTKLGVSGSILVNLQEPASDIDLVVYGTKSGYQVAETMKQLLQDKNSPIEAYDTQGLKELYEFRSKDTNITFKDFARTDSRKISHGKFMDKHFFIRFVKDINEIDEKYGDRIYQPEGYAKIKSTVTNNSQALFTPCSYEISDVQIIEGQKIEQLKEVSSFRGRFCEHAKNQEKIVAQGKLERVKEKGKPDYYRLLLGSKPSDYMILV